MIFPSQFRGFHVKAQEFKFTTSGAVQTWTRPSGISLVSILLVGAGGYGGYSGNDEYGGGGGGETLLYSVPITTDLRVIIGEGGGAVADAGEDSFIKDTSNNILLQARGGGFGSKDNNSGTIIGGLGGGTGGGSFIEGTNAVGGGDGGGTGHPNGYPGVVGGLIAVPGGEGKSKGGGGGYSSLYGMGGYGQRLGDTSPGSPLGLHGYCIIKWIS